MSPQLAARLDEVLEESRASGLLGPGSCDVHVSNALGFSEAVPRRSVVLDLGSGGGVPGLPLLVRRSDLRVTLLDAARRRTEFLTASLSQLAQVEASIRQRARIIRGRAEELATHDGLRESFDVVVARSFGPPAVTAECARPFVRSGGLVIVSEPPVADPARWPAEPLAELGLRVSGFYRSHGNGFAVLESVGECPPGLPRRSGVASRRPAY